VVFTIEVSAWWSHACWLEYNACSALGTTRPLVSGIYAFLGLAPLVRLARMALHPRETVRYYRAAVLRRLGRLSDPARR